MKRMGGRGLATPLRVLGMALVFGSLSAGVTAAKVDLRGRVLTSEGKPLPGAAVFIHTAKPRSGISTLCPSCYPDCGKMRRTGRDGRFVVPALSESLLFRVLVSRPATTQCSPTRWTLVR